LWIDKRINKFLLGPSKKQTTVTRLTRENERLSCPPIILNRGSDREHYISARQSNLRRNRLSVRSLRRFVP